MSHEKRKVLLMPLLAVLIALLGQCMGLSVEQSMILSVFGTSILGVLLFWHLRLSFVFVGSSLFFFMGAVTMEEFVQFASLDVLLFLVSMMVIVGMMKGDGLFTWLITLVLRDKQLTGLKLFVILMVTSAVFSGMMAEVPSIIIMTIVILNITDFLEIRPLPLIMASVLATNIGSASTVLGNPVGVLIAARGGLSFEDFIVHALPLSAVVLAVCIVIVVAWNRKYIKELTRKLEPFHHDEHFLHLISVPPDRQTRIGLGIFMTTIVLIALHHRLENLLHLEDNSLLIMIPVMAAGFVMMYRHREARHYIEREVEWPSLLFFMFLFAEAGILQSSGIAAVLADKLFAIAGDSAEVLTGVVLFSSGVLSSGLDNVVTVASFIPVVQSLDLVQVDQEKIWWALLFGACYGGNISMIGSTANIVALGLLEKERGITVRFSQWIVIGTIVGVVSMLMAYAALLWLPIF